MLVSPMFLTSTHECGEPACRLRAFSSDTASQLNVLRHDGNTLGVDGAQIGVLEETNEVRLRSFLKSHDCRALETQISLEILGNFPDEALKGKFADK